MEYFYAVIIIVAVYFLLVFFILRLVAPFMGFKQYHLPTNLPPEVREKIAELESGSKDQQAYLQAAFDFVMSRWYATRGKAVTELPKLFRKDLAEIWNSEGYAHCTTQNFILYTLLANSRFFKPLDVKIRHVFLNFVPHQYLQIKVGDKWVDVDPAGAGIRGFGIGYHASFIG